MLFPCPSCGTARGAYDAACKKCDWKPKPSHEAAATPGHRSLVDAYDRRQARQVAMLVIGALALLGGISLFKYVSKNEMGEPCDDNDGCRSKLCLPSVNKDELAKARLEYEERFGAWLSKIDNTEDDDEREALEKLKPTPPMLMPVYPGTCTEPCSNGECPVGWTCGTISVRTTFSFKSFRNPETHKEQVCFAPDDPMLAGTGE